MIIANKKASELMRIANGPTRPYRTERAMAPHLLYLIARKDITNQPSRYVIPSKLWQNRPKQSKCAPFYRSGSQNGVLSQLPSCEAV